MENKSQFNNLEDEEETENIIINEIDGLPNLHPNYTQLKSNLQGDKQTDSSIASLVELVHDEDLPTSVIVTNVDPRVFKSEELKVLLPNVFS